MNKRILFFFQLTGRVLGSFIFAFSLVTGSLATDLCFDDFSGNGYGWPQGSSWSGNMSVSVGPVSSSLVYSNANVYVAGGVDAVTVTSNVGGSSSHFYSRSIQEQTNTFYVSFLVRYLTTPNPKWDYFACGQKSDGGDTGVALGYLGSSSGAGAAFINDGYVVSTFGQTPPPLGTTSMMVVKYIWDASSESFISLNAFMNPVSASEESAEFSTVVNGTVADPFSSIDFQYYGSADVVFDEVRVGTTWRDVVPGAPEHGSDEGFLSVNINPDMAVQSGAAWGVVVSGTTNWYADGEAVTLDPDSYQVVYKLTRDFISPASEWVTVGDSGSTVLDRAYCLPQPALPEPLVSVYDDKSVSHVSGSSGGLLNDLFGVHVRLQSVESARLNESIDIAADADVVGSCDRASRPQSETWVFDWESLIPQNRTNTVDWGECDWIGRHTPSVGFDFSGDSVQHQWYGSVVEHKDPYGADSPYDYYPSGGEYYDLEAVYFDNDRSYLYIAFVTTAPFYNTWTNSNGVVCHDIGVADSSSPMTNSVVIPGDIAFDLGLNNGVSEKEGVFHYDFGINLCDEIRDVQQWITVNHSYSNNGAKSFTYKRPALRSQEKGSGFYRTADDDWYLSLDSSAAISAGSEHTNFDPGASGTQADYLGDVQTSVYRLDFPDGHLENDLPTYVYEVVVPRHLFGGADTNAEIKVRWLPTSCRNDGNADHSVFVLDSTDLDENSQYAALGNRVWLDDLDGIQGDYENRLGVSNITVVATCQDNGNTYTNITDSNGFYLFDSLSAGNYSVRFEVPDDYRLTKKNQCCTGQSAQLLSVSAMNLVASGVTTFAQPSLDTDEAKDSDADIMTWETDVFYLEAGTTNLTIDAGIYLYDVSLSTRISLEVYTADDDKVMIELSTVNENGNNDIEIYALINGEWKMVAAVPSEQIVGFGSNTYTVEAVGLTPGQSYMFRVVDECGHLFETDTSIEVASAHLRAVSTSLEPESFTMTFNTSSYSWYMLMVSESLSGDAGWSSEYVQVVHPAFPDGVSDYTLMIQGAPGGSTTLRVPRNRDKAFFKLIKVE